MSDTLTMTLDGDGIDGYTVSKAMKLTLDLLRNIEKDVVVPQGKKPEIKWRVDVFSATDRVHIRFTTLNGREVLTSGFDRIKKLDKRLNKHEPKKP